MRHFVALVKVIFALIIRNADFPNNYITEILNSIEKCEYLFISTELKEQKYCKHIILEKGQYLQDIL